MPTPNSTARKIPTFFQSWPFIILLIRWAQPSASVNEYLPKVLLAKTGVKERNMMTSGHAPQRVVPGPHGSSYWTSSSFSPWAARSGNSGSWSIFARSAIFGSPRRLQGGRRELDEIQLPCYQGSSRVCWFPFHCVSFDKFYRNEQHNSNFVDQMEKYNLFASSVYIKVNF